MRLVPGENRGAPAASAAVLVGAVAVLAAMVVSGHRLNSVAPLVAVLVVVSAAHEILLRWRSLILAIVCVILFVPIKRYSLPGSLPINLEPYRLLVFFVATGWITSLLIDPRVRVRKTPLDRPLALFGCLVLLSDVLNHSRVSALQADVTKKLLFFLSFFLVFYLIVSLVRTVADVDAITSVMVTGGAFVGLCALVERNTGFNLFNHLHTVFPFLQFHGGVDNTITRGGHLRVFGSAQHPIAMGAALMLLVPFGLYLAWCKRQRRWWLATALLVIGALATGSRTGAAMLGVIFLAYVVLRPARVRRLWPALLPMVLAIHFVTPGSLGTLHQAFFPSGGIIAQQTNDSVGSGRLATLWPALHSEFYPNPLFGEGFGTRITAPDDVVPVPNAPILDDQWLGILLETGIFGAAALLWLFLRFIRGAWSLARTDDDSARGRFLAAAIASSVSFAVSMLFYDAFAFIQATFMLFIVMALGVSVLLAPEPASSALRSRPIVGEAA